MAHPALTPELAQEIAGETSTIIGLNVLITDRDGVVIGSGDTARVGTVHEASLEVLRTLTPATHSAEQARRMRGVRPGITLPIVIDGDALGTVGLTGSPRRVRQFGQVVRRQTEILLRESMLVHSQFLREQALSDLVRDIAFFDADVVEPGAIAARARELGIEPRLPRTAVVVELPGAPSFSPLRILREVFTDPQDVVAEMTASRFAVLHHAVDEDELIRRCARLAGEIRQRFSLKATVGLGVAATDIAGLHTSYRDATAALRIGQNLGEATVFPIAQLRVHQLLDATTQHSRDRFVDTQLGPLPADPSWPMLRETIVAWCESGFNLVRAAEALRVHRNTLLYRLDKITRLAAKPVRDPAQGIAMYLASLAKPARSDR